MRYARFLAAALVFMFNVAAQAQPYRLPPFVIDRPTSSSGSFAEVMDSVPDIDGDGIAELAVSGGGNVRLYGGADGALLRTIPNPSSHAQNGFGASICGLDDVDGDTHGDLLIGAPDEAPNSSLFLCGKAYLFSGATGALLHTFQSPHGISFASFGFSVAPIEDLDGDDRPDLVIGALADNISSSFQQWGTVYVFSSATGLELMRFALEEEDVNSFFVYFGWSVDTMPDWSGDGKPEILIGATTSALDDAGDVPGLLYIVSAQAGAALIAIPSPNPTHQGEFGSAVAYLGDTNGDGQPDIAVGAPYERTGASGPFTGLTHILHLPAYSATPTVASTLLTPPQPREGGNFGRRLARIPDLTKDQVADLAVNGMGRVLYSTANSGQVTVFSGADGAMLQNIDLGRGLGGDYLPAMVGLASIDADARGDLAIGAYGHNNGNSTYGRVEIYSTSLYGPPPPDPTPNPTPTPTPTPLPGGEYFYTPPAEITQPYIRSNRFCDAIALVPDLNADGTPDILVGESRSLGPQGQTSAGAAHLYSGRTGLKLRTFFSPNAAASGGFGSGVAGVEDLDGDGAGDLLVGAYAETVVASNNGRAYLFSGATGALLRTFSSQRNPQNPGYDSFQWFGARVGVSEDLDGDGKQELVVGAPMEVNAFSPPLAGTGVVYTFSSATGAQLRRFAPAERTAGGAEEFYGDAFASVPDWTGDGKPDLVIGSRLGCGDSPLDQEGLVYLHNGATGALVRKFISPRSTPEGDFGAAVASLGDYDADGRGDAAIGAPGENAAGAPADSGLVYLYSVYKYNNNPSITIPQLQSPNPTLGGRFGASLAVIPDMTGDGKNELAVGAPGEPGAQGEAAAGRIYVFSGNGYTLLTTLFSPNAEAGDNFGSVLASGGSVDEDPAGDLLAGSFKEDFGPLQIGRSYVYATSPWPLRTATAGYWLYP